MLSVQINSATNVGCCTCGESGCHEVQGLMPRNALHQLDLNIMQETPCYNLMVQYTERYHTRRLHAHVTMLKVNQPTASPITPLIFACRTAANATAQTACGPVTNQAKSRAACWGQIRLCSSGSDRWMHIYDNTLKTPTGQKV